MRKDRQAETWPTHRWLSPVQPLCALHQHRRSGFFLEQTKPSTMKTPVYTHNEAVFVRLLMSNKEWVANPDLMDFTKRHCKSACYPIHSRISDLRTKYGYDVYNRTIEHDGVKHSSYMIALPDSQLSALRKMWGAPGRRGIPHYKQVQAKLRPVQSSIFSQVRA